MFGLSGLSDELKQLEKEVLDPVERRRMEKALELQLTALDSLAPAGSKLDGAIKAALVVLRAVESVDQALSGDVPAHTPTFAR